MKRKTTLLFSLLLLLIPMLGYSQSQRVSGRVTDAAGNTLPGVSIMLKGTRTGVSTDANGAYAITVAGQNAVLVFTYIGFTTQEQPVQGRSTINVVLRDDKVALQEVVVIGYGTQLRKAVSSAISSVKAEQITQTPVQRVEQSLQGRVAGVQVTNISGQPGDAPTVRIRGIGTNGNASPIYIVDGFQVGGIDYINPADIESMDVLKDAASAAIYGARGANGVVIITTKGGKKDGKMQVGYEGYTGFQNPWRTMNLLDAREYVTMMNEGAANAGRTIPFPDVSKYPKGHGTDWQKALFEGNAPITNHQLNVSGGTDRNSFNATFSLFDQKGIVGGDKSRFKRYTFRVNSDNKVKDFLKIGTGLAYSQIQRSAIDPNQEFGGLLNNAINIDPLTPVYETDSVKAAAYQPYSVRNSDGVLYAISPYIAQEVVNPLARLEVMHGRTRVDKLVGNTYADLKLMKGLSFRSSFGIDLAFVSDDNYSPVFYLNSAQKRDKSQVSKGTARYYTWQTDNVLTYSTSINQHSFDAVLGTTARKDNSENVYGANTGLVVNDPAMAYLNLAVDAGSAVATGGAGKSALFSLFGRVNYNYASKYLFSASLRRDGSSRFGKNNPFGYFPAVSAGWVFSDEDFMADSKVLNFGKLRASWGQNGNDDIGLYPWASLISVGRGYTFYTGSGKGYKSGASPAYVSNPDIKWEASEQTDIGLDLAFLNNRLSFTADYYIKTTKGWLLTVPIPLSVGVPAGAANGGSVRNSGLELALNFQQNFNDFKVSAGINGSFNKNEVTEIKNEQKRLAGATISTYGEVEQSTVGQPFSYFYGYKTDGIFQNTAEVNAYVNADGKKLQPDAQPGDVRFADTNGDGVIDPDDRTRIGNPTPKVTAGFNFSFAYKNVDLSGFMSGAFGNQIFNGTRRHDLSTSNMQSTYLNRWSGEGSTNEHPRFTWNDVNGNYTRISDIYLEDGDFVRMKTLQIGYNFAKPLLSKVSLQKLRIYVSADNLFTLTKYSGFDPEIGARSSLDIGIDRGIYPQARTYRIGLGATF